MSNFRIILKNGDNIKGGIHPNSSDFARITNFLKNDLCPHGVYLFNKKCNGGCHLLVNERLHIPGKNISFLKEKKILGESISLLDRILPLLCKIKHSKITNDEIVFEHISTETTDPRSALYGRNSRTHCSITICKRCGIRFNYKVWDEDF